MTLRPLRTLRRLLERFGSALRPERVVAGAGSVPGLLSRLDDEITRAEVAFRTSQRELEALRRLRAREVARRFPGGSELPGGGTDLRLEQIDLRLEALEERLRLGDASIRFHTRLAEKLLVLRTAERRVLDERAVDAISLELADELERCRRAADAVGERLRPPPRGESHSDRLKGDSHGTHPEDLPLAPRHPA